MKMIEMHFAMLLVSVCINMVIAKAGFVKANYLRPETMMTVDFCELIHIINSVLML